MTLTGGTTLGAYEIVSLLGRGGMGEVYRARDTRLGRSVAIKVLPDLVAADPERIARFEREARVLASLNHPHIAVLHGMEVADARHLLIMELVDGETLAERVLRGPVPPADALHIAVQIAEALEAAHAAGVVHRDLKPANIKIAPDDNVKVLDFGLAKAMDSAAVAVDLSQSPTLSMTGTHAGVILGTAAYMSPEQAKGLAADHRSDVFSFGCVLYEMLTGRVAFPGDSVPEILASILAREPDLTAVQSNLNPRIVEVLRRCLDKAPRRRWQAAGDLRAELEAIALRLFVEAPADGPRSARSAVPMLVGTAVVAAAIAGAAGFYSRPVSVPQLVVRFAIPLAEGQQFTAFGSQMFALSPDGGRIAFIADRRIFLRTLSDADAKPIPGAGGGSGPSGVAFSPDGGSIAYWSTADRTVKRIPIAGGSPITIAALPRRPEGGISWDESGILLGTPNRGVLRVSAEGGEPEQLIGVDDTQLAHGPQMLPGGKAILFTLAAPTL
jgi:eukaryotic-like serine/threonine-protein kinase